MKIKNRKSDYQTNSNHSTSSLKTIPMIMLFALNPSMLDAATRNNIYTESEPIVIAAPQTPQQNKDVVVQIGHYKDFSPKYGDAELRLVSVDGNNSDAEVMDVVFTKTRRRTSTVQGQTNTYNTTFTETLRVNSLIIEKVKIKRKDGSVKNYDVHYIAGKGAHEKYNVNLATGKITGRSKINVPNFRVPIMEQAYNDMKKIFGDDNNIEYKTEYKETDEYQIEAEIIEDVLGY